MFVAKGYNMYPFIQLHACCLELSGLLYYVNVCYYVYLG